VAVGEVDGRPIAVTGSKEGTMRLWDLRARLPVGEPLIGHTGSVTAVAVGEVDGRAVAISGSDDWTVRVWDLRTTQVHVMETGAPIKAVAYAPSSKILVATTTGLALLQLMFDDRSRSVQQRANYWGAYGRQ
jgi:WD40 repeat protein